MNKTLVLTSLVAILTFSSPLSADVFLTRIGVITMTPEQVAVITTTSDLQETKAIPPCLVSRQRVAWDTTTPYGRDMWDLARLAFSLQSCVVLEYDDAECGPDARRLKLQKITLRTGKFCPADR